MTLSLLVYPDLAANYLDGRQVAQGEYQLWIYRRGCESHSRTGRKPS